MDSLRLISITQYSLKHLFVSRIEISDEIWRCS